MTSDSIDIAYMQEALSLAAEGQYSTSPNPTVGCVIVGKGRVVGRGFHQLAGQDHAEIVAIKDAGELTKMATAYVTLEPCSHHGRTGPCVDALISSGVSRVVYACGDVNQQVSGLGHQALHSAGIEVLSGVCELQALELNRGYFKRMAEGKPYIRIKVAMSLDGAMAMSNGESKWITGNVARLDGQRLRAQSCGVLTGIGTVLAVDPLLNVREKRFDIRGRNPTRIILDTHLRCPRSANIFSVDGRVLIFSGESVDEKRYSDLSEVAEIQSVKELSSGMDLEQILFRCASDGMNNLLIEAGPILTREFIERKLFDELIVYIAPKIIGEGGRRAFQVTSPETLSEVLGLKLTSLESLGGDIAMILVPDVL